MTKIVVLSDIHANLTALQAVLDDISTKYQPDALAILGDNINYGMRPNEVIHLLTELKYPIIANLRGNHEKALLDGNLDSFSTERGKDLLRYTASVLSNASISYMEEVQSSEGFVSVEVAGKRFLFIHGSLEDPYWGKITSFQISNPLYNDYDFVVSGHTHLPHYMEYYFKADCPSLRNKKKTVFLNPGSVGQPRNQNPCAQYLYLDVQDGVIHHNAVPYDVELEQVLYPISIDSFYKDRLIKGV